MNPAYHHKFGYTELWGDAGVQKDLHKMMGRFFNTVTEKQAAVAQLSQYTRWHGVRDVAPCQTCPALPHLTT